MTTDTNDAAERLDSHAARSLAADGRWPADQRHLIVGQLEQVEREVRRATVERIRADLGTVRLQGSPSWRLMLLTINTILDVEAER